MDRRMKKTRKAIFEAFDTLISKRNYEKITIQDIIDEADIGRSTFYDHFETKDSLLVEKCENLFNHIFNPESDEINHVFTRSSSLKEKVEHILYHLLEEKDVIKGILTSSARGIFLGSFRERLTLLFKNLTPKDNNVPLDYFYNFLIQNLIFSIDWWIKDNFTVKPEKLANYYFFSISSLLVNHKN